MATSFAGIKTKLDKPSWQATPLIYNALHVIQTGAAGSTLAGDKRPSQYKLDKLFFINTVAQLFQYSSKGNGWMQLQSPALAGTFGIGAVSVYCPSLGPRGTIAAGASTTSVTLSTVLPVTVSANQLKGQRLRIVNNIAGGGQTAERTIVSNTPGTAPVIVVDSAFGFTPATGATYEFLTGRLYLMSAGTVAAGIWKYYDVCTNSMSGNLSTTNLPATVGTGSAIVALDEQHTPITGVGGVAINGETGGYFGTLTATAIAGTTLTGQAVSGDSSVLANEYRNFQIRIVTDTVNPTAVGQRRRITSHTAGASPVYTVPAWSVTPSATCSYVIENNNDILFWTAAATTTYRYEPIGNAWDTTTYAVKPAANAAGTTAFHPFGTVLNASKTIRHSYIYNFRGGVSNALDIFDIAAATTGAWTADVVYYNRGLVTFGSSAGSSYNAVDNVALVVPINLANVQTNMYYFDVDRASLMPYAPCPQISGAVVDGDRLAVDFYVDGTDKKAIFGFIPPTGNYMLTSLFFK